MNQPASTIPDYEMILYSLEGPIARITLNRPERLNALNRALIAELQDAVGRANAEPDVKVIVLRGAGRGF